MEHSKISGLKTELCIIGAEHTVANVERLVHAAGKECCVERCVADVVFNVHRKRMSRHEILLVIVSSNPWQNWWYGRDIRAWID